MFILNIAKYILHNYSQDFLFFFFIVVVLFLFFFMDFFFQYVTLWGLSLKNHPIIQLAEVLGNTFSEVFHSFPGGQPRNLDDLLQWKQSILIHSADNVVELRFLFFSA